MQDEGLDNDAMMNCGDCQLEYQDTIPDGVSCSSRVDIICLKTQACSSQCGNCDKEILDHQVCNQLSCFNGTCPSPAPSRRPTPSPTPAPNRGAPTDRPSRSPILAPNPGAPAETFPSQAPSADPCGSLQDGLDACTSAACTSCWNALNPASCDDFEYITCFVGTICPDCAPCADDFLAWNNCLAEAGGGCSSFECDNTSPPSVEPAPQDPTLAPTPLRCPDENNAYWSCVADFTSGDSTACRQCRNDFVPDQVNTCADSEYLTCRISSQCPMCGPCHDEQVAWTNCLNAREGGCDPLTCATEGPTGAPERAARAV
jgi:hypothetical protein